MKDLGTAILKFKREHPEAKALPESKMESLVEKCEVAVRQLHRANSQDWRASHCRNLRLFGNTVRSDERLNFDGRVSSYDMNTFKGRDYLRDSHRPVPFVLNENARTKRNIRLITRSLALNAENPDDPAAELRLVAHSFSSRTGRLKWLLVDEIEPSVV